MFGRTRMGDRLHRPVKEQPPKKRGMYPNRWFQCSSGTRRRLQPAQLVTSDDKLCYTTPFPLSGHELRPQRRRVWNVMINLFMLRRICFNCTWPLFWGSEVALIYYEQNHKIEIVIERKLQWTHKNYETNKKSHALPWYITIWLDDQVRFGSSLPLYRFERPPCCYYRL